MYLEYLGALSGCSGSMDRLNALIETNIRWVRQALELLDGIDDAQYATPPDSCCWVCSKSQCDHTCEKSCKANQ